MIFLHKKVSSLSVAERCDITALWQEAFGDTEEFVNFMLDGALSDAYFFAAQQNNTLCSMFFLVGIKCKTETAHKDGVYIYAVATKKELRGKGIFPKLFSFATDFVKTLGVKFVLCKPSSQKLFDYYARLGFENVCFSRDIQIKPEKSGYNFVEQDFCEKLYGIYLENKTIPHTLVKTYLQLEKSLECAKDTDYKLISFECGFALINYGKKHIKYICAPKEKLLYIASAIFGLVGKAGTLTVYSEEYSDGALPYAMSLFFDGQKHGMVCPLLFE